MALMPRSKLKGKGRPHKTKSYKKQNNGKLLKAKSSNLKRKQKGSSSGDVHMAAARPAATSAKGGDDDDFADMAADPELLTLLEDEGTAAAEVTKQKKKKKQRKKGPKKASALEFEATRGLATVIADAAPDQQADWLWASYSDHAGVGPEQRGGFDGSYVISMSGGGSLEDCLRSAAGADWATELASSAGRPHGAPSVLLISPSANGANDLIKQLPTLNQACKVAKLFARHFKVPEQQAMLLRSAPAIAVGTPHRLAQLHSLGALKLDRLKLVLIDVALDAKQRTILDIPETRGDFWRFFQQAWGPLLAAHRARVGLFNSSATSQGSA